jgi:hypothetical protein
MLLQQRHIRQCGKSPLLLLLLLLLLCTWKSSWWLLLVPTYCEGLRLLQ